MMVNPKAVVVLKALLMGLTIHMEGYNWRYKDGVGLCVVMVEHRSQTERLVRPDVSMGAFVNMAKKLSQEEMAEIVANMALNAIRRKQRRNVSQHHCSE